MKMKNKKKRTIGKLLSIILVSTFLLTACSQNNTIPVEKKQESQDEKEDVKKDIEEDLHNDSETKEIQSNEETESEALTDDANGKQLTKEYYKVGETVMFTNGLELTLIDAGSTCDDNGRNRSAFVYVKIENTGTETIAVSPYDFSFYGDDFTLPLDVITFSYDMLYSENIAPGRKTAGKVYAECLHYEDTNIVEVQFGDAIFRIKDEKACQQMDQMIYSMFSGKYVKVGGDSLVSISMNSSVDYNSIGTAMIFSESGECEYFECIAEVEHNLYRLLNTYDDIYFEVYETDYKEIYLNLYINDEYIGEYIMVQQYIS